MDWKELGAEVAKLGLPLLGQALLPVGGAAIGAALASHLGATDGKPETVLAALTGDAQSLQKAREFEATNQRDLLQLTLAALQKAYETEIDDRKSARDRDTKIVQTTGKRNYQATSMYVLAVLVIVALTWAVLFDNDNSMNEYAKGIVTLVLGRFLGYLDGIYNFEFGTTRSSQMQQQTINALAAPDPAPAR